MLKPNQTMSHALPASCLSFAAACAAQGLDLVVPFDAIRYNARATPEHALPFVSRPHSLALLIGNTRALWPAFRQAVGRDAALASDPDPLDRYVVREIERALPSLPARARVLYGHTSEPRVIPLQRVAEAIGFAVISPSHLSVHASYGPWFALRAVVLVDLPAFEGELGPAPNPCLACEKPCVAALNEALAAARAAGLPLERAVREDFPRWTRVREVCPEGRAFRYPSDQLEYHYAKNRLLLRGPE